MTRKSSRRDFLKGRLAADAMADALQSALPDERLYGFAPKSPAGPAAGKGYLVHVSRRAMACEFEISFNAGQYEHDTEFALEALDLVDAVEAQLSVFRETSDVCHINRTAAVEPVQVEPRLFELLRLAVRVHDETDGALDVTSTPLWEVWGFARRAGAMPDEEQLVEARKRVGSHLIEFDTRRRTVGFRQPGLRLNLGSLGKGYALDRCAEKLLQDGIGDFLIHGGGSSVLARGRRATGQHSRATGQHGRSAAELASGWTVGVPHPLRGDRRLAEIRLGDRALATSGSRAQSFVHGGRRYGHILDPRTGQPAEGVISATVVCSTATRADALATAFYVMGPQASLDYCRSRPEIGVLLVCPVRRDGGIEVHTAGLAENDLTML